MFAYMCRCSLLMVAIALLAGCLQVKVSKPDILFVTGRTADTVMTGDAQGVFQPMLKGDAVVVEDELSIYMEWDLRAMSGMRADGGGELKIAVYKAGEELNLCRIFGRTVDADFHKLGENEIMDAIGQSRLVSEGDRTYRVFDLSTREVQRLIDGKTAGFVLEGKGRWELGRVGDFGSLSFGIRNGE